jgi:hypothetical protein
MKGFAATYRASGRPRRTWAPAILTLFAELIGVCAAPTAALGGRRADGQLEIEVVEAETGQPMAARVHVRNTRGRAVRVKAPDTAHYSDHFYIDGKLTLPLGRGQYTMELEAGPEFRTVTSQPFEIERHADDTKRIEMPRFANLADEGWWAGDLDVARLAGDLPLAMRAEGIHIVPCRSPSEPATTTARRTGAGRAGDHPALMPLNERYLTGRGAVLDERFGGGLLVCDVPPSLDLSNATPYSPTSLTILRDAHHAGGRVIARTPYAWDLPVWLASGELDAIGLIHHHSLRDDVLNREDDGRPRDVSLFPGASGNGRWSEAVYHRMLECGLRIPPAAGSGTGTNGNPLGHNRVYVHCGDELSYERWWDGLAAGRVFVTNGPLLRPRVEGKLPGHVFRLEKGTTLELEIALDLATRVPVEYLQVIKNGRLEVEVRLADWKNKPGRLPPLVFHDSGWFLIRAVTNNQRTYQFASSGPYYVEQDRQPRVSRQSVQFFLDWIAAAKKRIDLLNEIDEAERAALLADQEFARQYFASLLAAANAD